MTTPTTPLRRLGATTWLYGLTILVGAFLVFQVQPIISKTILPWFGGSPAVWTTCMLFFQVVLFAGYAYAHLLIRLRPRLQTVVHVALIGTALLLVPIIPDPSWKLHGGDHPTWTILLLLATTVGVPYFLLSSTGPLIQFWFDRAHPGKTPYRLYALSNAGSLAALLTYPFLVEPAMTTWAQSTVWSLLFILFAVSCSLCAVIMRRWVDDRREPRPEDRANDAGAVAAPAFGDGARPGAGQCGSWVFLAAVPSVMLLATTNHVCQDVAVIPFLWVIPLSLYLVSFIICFDRERWYSRLAYGLGAMLSIGAISAFPLLHYGPPLPLEVGLYFTALFCICMVCHGELVLRKPAPRHLTLFYLMCSAGGALGGVLVALVCPCVFTGYFEMNLGLIAAYLIAAFAAFADPRVRRWLQGKQRSRLVLYVFVGFVCVVRVQAGTVAETGLVACRNFYGVLSVVEVDAKRPEQRGRAMVHGRITHGFQFRDPARRRLPTTYYARESGVGIVLGNYPRLGPMRVGIIGLGAGTIAAYGRPGDTYRFYEINPEVERLARDYFTFLDDSPARVQVVIGDARLSLERESPQHFDLLVLDAFSGDAIPAHLLTKEAFAVYRRHLRPDGVVAVHISNRYLDLYPVVDQLARHSRMPSLYFVVGPDAARHRCESRWFVMSSNRQLMDNALVRSAAVGHGGQYAVAPLWTDQYNNLFRVLK